MSESEEGHDGPKRRCTVATPESMKIDFGVGKAPRTSTPTRRNLNLLGDSPSNPSCKVRVTNLPDPFMELTFTTFLDKFLRRNELVNENEFPPSYGLPKGEVPKKVVLSCKKDADGVTVELPSLAMTEGLLKLKSTKYLRQTINFDNVSDTDNIAYDMSTLNQSMDEINATVESDNTRIEGVESPSVFIYVLNVKRGDKKYLKFMINDLLWEAECAANGTNCILSVHNEIGGVDKLELINEKCANHLILIESCDFLGSTINFAKEAPTTASSFLNLSATDVLKDSTEVYVTGLPPQYNMTLLKFTVNDILWNSSLGVQDTNCIRSCEEKEGLLKLELINEGCANHLIVIESCDFGESTINFVKEAPATAPSFLNLSATEMLKDSEVYVTGLPPQYNMTLLKFTVNDILWNSSLGVQDTNCIRSCEEKEGLLKLELINEGCANHLILIESCDFGELKISFQRSRGLTLSEGFNVPLLQNIRPGQNRKDASYLMTSDGKRYFLKKLISARKLFGAKKNFPSGYARLMAELDKDGIDIGITELAARRKYWLDTHNKIVGGSKKNIEYQKPLSVIFGNASADILENAFKVDTIDITDEAKVAATAALFTKGAVWTSDAEKYFLRLVRTNLDTLKYSKKQDLFWQEISKLLAEKGYYYNYSSCSSKFDSAKTLYRNEMQRLARTGEPSAQFVHGNRPLWYFSEDMQFIMAKDVTVEAPRTLACGSSNRATVRKSQDLVEDDKDPDDPGSDQDQQQQQQRVGKGRVPQLMRPKPKVDQKADAMYQLVKAFNRRTDVLERKMNE